MSASRRWLWIALGCALITVLAVGLLVIRRSPVVAGRPSAAQVITDTFAAIAAGDLDALVAITDPEGMFAMAVSCEDEDDDRDPKVDEAAHDADARDPSKIIERARKDYQPLLERARGLTIEVVAIRGPEPSSDREGLVARGSPMMKGCVATRDLRFHRVTVKLRVRDTSGASQEQDVGLGIVEVDGRWFLATPPQVRRPR